MNANRKVVALAAAVFLVFASVSGVAGAVAAGNAANSAGNLSAAGNLGVTVDQSGNTAGATVVVTAGNQPLEGANVDVTADTDYAGAGEYQTDANGEVSLPAPAETTEVTVVATYGDSSAETTEVLEPREFENFGQQVSFFVHSLLGDEDTDGGIGQQVSEFVKKNNPSNDNKPDHAGGPGEKPEQAGGPDKDKPEQAGGPDKDKDTGKPAHAGGPNDADTTEDDEDDEDDEDSNNGNGNGNAKGK